jgi:hypothetical protein
MFGPGAKVKLNALASKIVTSGTFFVAVAQTQAEMRSFIDKGAPQDVPSLTIFGAVVDTHEYLVWPENL